MKKGLYEEDLGKIFRIKKNFVDVEVEPRINLQEFTIRAKEQTRNITDEAEITKMKEELLRRYLNHLAYYPKHLRPVKKQLFENDFK